MNNMPEWTDLRYFLELARVGTLSGASRRLGVEHTTVARRIDRLETQLGAALFDRSREGYELTEMGQTLLPHAETMESAALMATDQLGSSSITAHGVVRLGVPEMFGTLVIAPLLVSLLQNHPDLSIDLLVQPRFANLANREADLGVMLDPPNTGRYVFTRLATFRLNLYASPDYLARHPPIVSNADLARHDFVDYVQDRLASSELNFLDKLGFTPRRRMCSTGMMAQCQAAAAGLGLIMAPPYAIPADGSLVPVLRESFYTERSYWLAAPTDLYRLQRVRIVWNLLREFSEQNPSLFVHPDDRQTDN
ncbi:MAG: LysR family transcriptional regulator [Burkholderiales bacterium]|nr:LysR family transcriptional regulator [Burkholderiales bacterium]